MKHSPTLLFTSIFLSLFFFACGPESTKKQSLLPQTYGLDYLQSGEDVLQNDRELDELFADDDVSDTEGFTNAKPEPNAGKIVPRKFIEYCLLKYDTVMRNHGIDTVDQKDIDIHLTKTMLTTYWERFRGTEMMRFLRHAAHIRKKLNGRKHLGIRVSLGVYTKAYIDSITVAPEKPDYSKVGRIAVFLVTRKWPADDGSKPYIVTQVNEPDDPDGYDFGGLKP